MDCVHLLAVKFWITWKSHHWNWQHGCVPAAPCHRCLSCEGKGQGIQRRALGACGVERAPSRKRHPSQTAPSPLVHRWSHGQFSPTLKQIKLNDWKNITGWWFNEAIEVQWHLSCGLWWWLPNAVFKNKRDSSSFDVSHSNTIKGVSDWINASRGLSCLESQSDGLKSKINNLFSNFFILKRSMKCVFENTFRLEKQCM